jgi:hypothetical protein
MIGRHVSRSAIALLVGSLLVTTLNCQSAVAVTGTVSGFVGENSTLTLTAPGGTGHEADWGEIANGPCHSLGLWPRIDCGSISKGAYSCRLIQRSITTVMSSFLFPGQKSFVTLN